MPPPTFTAENIFVPLFILFDRRRQQRFEYAGKKLVKFVIFLFLFVHSCYLFLSKKY